MAHGFADPVTVDARRDPGAFVRATTSLVATPLLPELRLRLADEVIELWEETEARLEQLGVAPPFWAFAWPGGQALARYLLDHPELSRGRRVLDVAAGSGLAAIAAARIGAAAVTATEVDPLAVAAIELNAAANDVTLEVVHADVLDGDGGDAEVVLIGDLCYERPVAERVAAFIERAHVRGATVLLGDPGRAYLPPGLVPLARYDVPVLRGLEDRDVKLATVYRPA